MASLSFAPPKSKTCYDMKKILAMALLALIGCASNKAVVNPVAKTEDDPRCEKFYELMDKNFPIGEFSDVKVAGKELGFDINEPIDIYERSVFQMLESYYSFRCNETVTCNQKDYCIAILFLKDNKVVNLLEYVISREN